MKAATCKNPDCAKDFIPKRRNQFYCSVGCKKAVQKERDKISYDSIKQFRRGALANLKLMRKWVSGQESFRIKWSEAFKAGFDDCAFYNLVELEDDRRGFRLNPYCFAFSGQGEDAVLEIHKISSDE
jgi:hypothetical protein